jgi:DNA polymerase-3 subunit gamma/tau
VAPELVQLPDRRRAVVADQAKRLGLPGTVRAMEVLGEVLVELRHAPDPRVLLDVALVKLTNIDADSSPAALLARIEKLERAQAAQPAPIVPAVPPGAIEGESSRRARLGSAVRAGAAEPAARPSAPPVVARADEPPSPPPENDATAPAAGPGPAVTEAAGDSPSRDDLTLAWADQLLPRLSQKAKSVLAAGRWVDTEQGVALAVPNEPHRTRCEQHRTELEGALTAHFGRPIAVTFVLEGAFAGAAPAAGKGATRADPAARGGRSAEADRAAEDATEDEAIDPAELVDAGPEHDLAPLERLAQAFPGAELVDEG